MLLHNFGFALFCLIVLAFIIDDKSIVNCVDGPVAPRTQIARTTTRKQSPVRKAVTPKSDAPVKIKAKPDPQINAVEKTPQMKTDPRCKYMIKMTSLCLMLCENSAFINQIIN